MIEPLSSPFGGIVQVAYVTNDIDTDMRRWTDLLGIGPWFLFRNFAAEHHRYRGAALTGPWHIDLALAYCGSTCYELIQQHHDGPSPYWDTLGVNGTGFHHWALASKDYDAMRAHYLAQGHQEAFSCRVAVGGRASYIDTHASLGGMIEIIELLPHVESLFSHIRETAAGWDGKDPIRTL